MASFWFAASRNLVCERSLRYRILDVGYQATDFRLDARVVGLESCPLEVPPPRSLDRREEGARLSHAVMASALKEAASEKLEGFSQDVKVRLVP